MNDISALTDDELRYICKRTASIYFKNHRKQFQVICPERDPRKLPANVIENIVVSNRNTLTIRTYVLEQIQLYLDYVHAKIHEKSQTIGFRDAVCEAIDCSLFRKNVDLYLKIAENTYAKEYVEKLRRILNAPKEDTDKTLTLPYSEVGESEQAIGTQCCEENVSKKTENISKALEQEHTEPLNSSASLPHVDTSTARDSAYPFTSLCRVKKSMGSSGELLRLADIVDGVIQPQRRSDTPDRDIIYTQDRTKPEGFIGIWNWRTDYNPKSGRENYVTSSYAQEKEATQVILNLNAKTVEELKADILHGIEAVPAGNKTLFAISASGHYTGLLCTENDLLIQDAKTKLRVGVASLPLYEFFQQEIIGVKGLYFLANINIGQPSSFLRIMEPLEAIKTAVLLRSPIAKLKSWMTIRESREMRTFLQEMPTTDFYQEIADACACSLEEAAAYTDTFIQRAETYLHGDDIESEILESVINHSPSILEKCRMLNEKTWQREHKSELEVAQAELNQIKSEILQQMEQRAKLADQVGQAQEHIENLSLEIAQKEKLAADIKAKVAQRISAAKKDVAEFISEMAFTQSAATEQVIPLTSTNLVLFQPGSMLGTDLIEHQEPWDVVRTIQEGLEEAGVVEQYSLEFAAYLYAAYTAHIPLLLAGPNGRDIVDALSAALWGRTASSLCCEGEYNIQTVEECLNSDYEIVAVQNLLNTRWVDHIPELLGTREKFMIVLHPFAEDLIIEPKGLYDYLLPVLTELLVERSASKNFSGGYFCNEFPQYKHAEPQKKLPLVEKLSMPLLVQNKLRQILADMKSLSETSSTDSDILFGVLPYAYVTGKFEIICEELQKGCPLSKTARELIQTLGAI